MHSGWLERLARRKVFRFVFYSGNERVVVAASNGSAKASRVRRPSAKKDGWPAGYFIGEKSVASVNVDSTLVTIAPFASEAALTRCQSGSALNEAQLAVAAC